MNFAWWNLILLTLFGRDARRSLLSSPLEEAAPDASPRLIWLEAAVDPRNGFSRSSALLRREGAGSRKGFSAREDEPETSPRLCPAAVPSLDD